jgi:hypothetical protein
MLSIVNTDKPTPEKIMNTITFSSAQREFGGEIQVGQYVAWWISGTESMTLVSDSYPTPEAAEAAAAAAEMLDDPYYRAFIEEGRTLREIGKISIEMVMPDEQMYMNPKTGSIETEDGWEYTNEAGETVSAVDLGEVVPVWPDGEGGWTDQELGK